MGWTVQMCTYTCSQLRRSCNGTPVHGLACVERAISALVGPSPLLEVGHTLAQIASKSTSGAAVTSSQRRHRVRLRHMS